MSEKLAIHDYDPSFRKALKTVGGRRPLARLLGISHQAIAQWKRIPAERVMEVEKVTGITRSTLRPDIYPKHREREI
jgi:DNA-binding transcriptional regulator YdaS (Cro superfamily)